MKRLYIGICVLFLLLALGLLTSFFINRMYDPIAQLLEDASQAALREDLSAATEKAKQAKALWDQCKQATATVADHTPMEEIDHLFAEAKIYAQSEELPHFAACCAQLAVMVRDMGDAHKPNLWNLL